jgi:uncharacterized membrane protein
MRRSMQNTRLLTKSRRKMINHITRTAPSRRISSLNGWFWLILLCSVVFVIISSLNLPATVASHFVASGAANGFMPGWIYQRTMVLLIIIFPTLLAYLSSWSLNSPDARINLPNREYWLAPQRRETTLRRLRRSMKTAAMMLTLFLDYVHWLVVQANQLTPPHMDADRIFTAIIIFSASMLYWAWRFVKPFRTIPEQY